MDWRAVLFVLGRLTAILGICLIAPLGVALGIDSGSPLEGREIAAFAITSSTCVAIGLSLHFIMRSGADRIGHREAYAIVTMGWILAGLVGMIPYVLTGVTGSVADAFFEAISGFTTTGATVFGDPGHEIEALPHGLLLWRGLTQWLGGMGIVVLFVALLSAVGQGGYHLLKAESPGGIVFEKDAPRIADTAKEMWKIYAVFSLAQVAAMMATGTSLWDAVTHTFATMSTGGFSPHVESIGYFGPATQWVVIVFMFAAGANFTLYSHLLRGRWRVVARNPELIGYTAIMLGCGILGAIVIPSPGGAGERFRDSLFAVVSVGTTTGFVTVDFDRWPEIMRLVLVLLMFVGGCMGSTGGGMKVARIILFAKAIVGEMFQLLFPHAVRPVRSGGRVVDRRLVQNIMAFGLAYLAFFTAGTAVMAACGYDLVTSTTATASCLGNVGPGLARVGPVFNYRHLPDVATWAMSVLMLVGRLEIWSVVILLTPWAWRR